MSRFKILTELSVQDGDQKNCDILVNLDYIVHCVPGRYRLVSKPAVLEYLNIGDDEERYKKTVIELKGTEIHLADGKEYILAYEFEEFCKMILKEVCVPAPIKDEQKTTEWSEEDDTMLNEIIASVNGFDATSGTTTMNFGKHEAKINWLKTIKYKALAQLSDEWSEEDETSLSDIIKCLEEHKHCMLTEEHDIRINLGINFLKSLKYRVQPQPKWKPSDEQIMALRWVLNHIPYDSHKEEISGLLEQLKKLREE